MFVVSLPSYKKYIRKQSCKSAQHLTIWAFFSLFSYSPVSLISLLVTRSISIYRVVNHKLQCDVFVPITSVVLPPLYTQHRLNWDIKISGKTHLWLAFVCSWVLNCNNWQRCWNKWPILLFRCKVCEHSNDIHKREQTVHMSEYGSLLWGHQLIARSDWSIQKEVHW